MKRLLFLFLLLITYTTYAQKMPKELVICVSNTELSDKKDNFSEPLRACLAKELKMPVKIYEASTIFDLVDKLQSGEVHLAHINPFGQVLASNDAAIIPFMARGSETGDIETYASCIFTAKSTGITKIEDLSNKASALEMVFVNPTSTSGHLLPRLYLNSQNLQAETVFSNITFADNHQKAIEMVAQTPNTIGACAYSYLQQQMEKGLVNKDDIQILWVSDGIPFGPVVIQENLPAALQTKLENAYKNIQKDETVWALVQKLWKSPTSKYVKAPKTLFDSLSKITNDSDDLIFILNFYKE